MKNLKSVFLVLIFFMMIYPARSQWIPCQGIEGADTRDIILHDSDLFIITKGNGIYKKYISSTTWETACVIGGFSKIRATSDALFAFGSLTAFIKSLNNGLTWQTFEDYPLIRDLETVDSCLFIVDYNHLLRSKDNGVSWTTIYPSSGTPYASEIFAQDGTLFCYLTMTDSIYRTDNCGESWSQFPTTGFSESINDVYNYNGELWLASDAGIYRFDEILNIWNKMQDSIPENTAVHSFIEETELLFCCTDKGFYKLSDQDSLWIANNAGLESLVTYAACNIGNTNYIATASGPFLKQEEASWNNDFDHLFQKNVSQVFAIGSRIYILCEGQIYFSDTITKGFEKLETQGYCSSQKMIITDTTWYAASICGFLKSFDSGLTWSAHTAGMDGQQVADIALTDSFYFARVYSGLYRTMSDSIAWGKVPNNLGSANVWGVSSINNVVFASVYSDIGLHKSTDNGTSFVPVPEGDSYAPELFVKDDKIFILNDSGPILYSTNSGISWQIWISGLQNDLIVTMDITNSFDTTILGGGFLTSDLTDYYLSIFTPENPSGIDVRDNLPLSSYPYIQNVFLNNGRIFACPSNNGLWYREDLMVGVKDDLNKKVPSGSLLLFPNPVGDFLKFDLVGNGDQSEYLIYDQLGRMIKRDLCRKDNSQITIDVSGLRQGAYFIVIRDDNGGSRAGKFVEN